MEEPGRVKLSKDSGVEAGLPGEGYRVIDTQGAVAQESGQEGPLTPFYNQLPQN